MADETPPATRRQVRRMEVLAVATVHALIDAGDPDLWMRAYRLAEDAVFARRRARRERGDGASATQGATVATREGREATAGPPSRFRWRKWPTKREQIA
ncbi:hypothetical protein GCM10009746_26560 [Microbacterium paludicola]